MACSRQKISIIFSTYMVLLMAYVIDPIQCYCSVSTIMGMNTANCDNRSLKSVPNTLRDDLKVFKISHNHFNKVMSESFKMYPGLHEVYMRSNKIKLIDKNAFLGLTHLNLLDLSNNELKNVPYSCFIHLNNMTILKLDGNPISKIEHNILEYMQNLSELSLENCSITNIGVNFFKNTYKLSLLNIAGNRLTTLSEDIKPYLKNSQISFFRLNNNKWNCDCKLKWFRAWLVTAPVVWESSKEGPRCYQGVNKVVNQHWKKLHPNDFVCPITIIAVEGAELECKVNSFVTFQCLVHGDPEPVVYWLRNNQNPLLYDLKFTTTINKLFTDKTNESRILSTAIITNVTQNSFGDYVCVAENNYTRSEKMYSLVMALQTNDHGAQMQYVSNNYDYTVEQDENQIMVIASLISVVFFAFLSICVAFYVIWRKKRWASEHKVPEVDVDSTSKSVICIESNEYSQVSGCNSTKPFYGGTNSRVFPFFVSDLDLNQMSCVKIKKSQTTSTTIDSTPSKSPHSKNTVPFYSVISESSCQNGVKILPTVQSSNKIFTTKTTANDNLNSFKK